MGIGRVSRVNSFGITNAIDHSLLLFLAMTGAVIDIFFEESDADTGAVIDIFLDVLLMVLLPKIKSASILKPLLDASSKSPIVLT